MIANANSQNKGVDHMSNIGYCDLHHRAFEIKRIPGSWVYECPQCRAEGKYDTIATTSVKPIPQEQWILSDHIIHKKEDPYAKPE